MASIFKFVYICVLFFSPLFLFFILLDKYKALNFAFKVLVSFFYSLSLFILLISIFLGLSPEVVSDTSEVLYFLETMGVGLFISVIIFTFAKFLVFLSHKDS